jgi:hypothetical protein
MSYQVVNEATQEVAAMLDERDLAIKLAERLAKDCDYRERWLVIETRTIHETKGSSNGLTK